MSRRTRRPDLAERLAALAEAVDAGEGRLPDALVADAREVLARAGQRQRLSPDHTVVALAGATGSGKSSLFNAVAGIDLARTGVRRPTTSQALACVWGAAGAGPLLDWLGIPARHQLSRTSALDRPDDAGRAALTGLVLLDLPDHDSTQRAHRDEVDRLVSVVDLMVWVVDPQKYADAALHERYLRPMASHAAVTVVVLNQVDRLPPTAVQACVTDLRRLLAEDGLGDVPVLTASATTGAGVPALHDLLRGTVAARAAAGQRLAADASAMATKVLAVADGETPPGVRARDRTRLAEALADAAGVVAVQDAVRRSYVLRATRSTGWPLTRWLARLAPDPVRRFRLDRAGVDPALVRTSLPAPGPVARARVQSAVRALGDAAAAGAPPGWRDSVAEVTERAGTALPDTLDRAVAGTDLGTARRPRWWAAVGMLQWLVLAAAVVGGLWLLGLVALSYLQLPEPALPDAAGVPVPTLLLVAGLLVGLLVGMLGRVAGRAGGRRRARRAGAALRAALAQVGDASVLEPVQAELASLRACRLAARRAAG